MAGRRLRRHHEEDPRWLLRRRWASTRCGSARRSSTPTTRSPRSRSPTRAGSRATTRITRSRPATRISIISATRPRSSPRSVRPRELHELVDEAHARGIRVIPDFVANHIHTEAKLYTQHPGWFFPYNACDNRWDVARIGCWFTTDTPDFDFGAHPDAVEGGRRSRAVADPGVQLRRLPRRRAQAHGRQVRPRTEDRRSSRRVETTVIDHARAIEPTVFYMVGESLGGWARYHVREDMVQGQVDEELLQPSRRPRC